MRHWMYKHTEELCGVIFGLFHSLIGENMASINLDIMEIFIKVLSDVPGFFAAGFFGGMGGYMIRMTIKFIHLGLARNRKKDEQNP